MGRYYDGDISGKFWFAIQSSDAPERFGASALEPSSIDYFFEEEELDVVSQELKHIEDNIISKIGRTEYESHNIPTIRATPEHQDFEAIELLAMKHRGDEKFLSELADYQLGCRIEASLKLNGQCSFTAEL